MASSFRFRTEISSEPARFGINYNQKGLFLGSCFTEHIGKKMQQHKFSVTVNPFGVLYNPASVARVLDRLLANKAFLPDELFEYQQRYLSFYHDTAFSADTSQAALALMNESLEQGHAGLHQARYLFVTWGTAYVYEFKESGKVVTNCHKLPAAFFQRRKLSVAAIVERWTKLLQRLWKNYPDVQVVFTVSPVRHWKDGAVGNQHSKATLHCAIHDLLATDNRLHYFPSYELMMDDLRDYRFYADDMFHPSSQAVAYIWSFFQDTYFSDVVKAQAARMLKLYKATRHRILGSDMKATQRFAQQQLRLVDDLSKTFAYLDFEEERAYFTALLNH